MDMRLINSFKRHLKFVLAPNFITSEGKTFYYHPTFLEKWGSNLLVPFVFTLETFIKYLNWQFLIFGIVLASLIATTIFYYPDQITQSIEKLIPVLKWEYTKLFFFIFIQWYIQSTFMRTWGRLSNEHLMNAWLAREIQPSLFN